MTLSRVDLLERLRALAATADAAPGAPENDPAASSTVEDPGVLRGELERAPVRTLRVNVETLDRILDLTGEIAVERGRLREALDTGESGAQGTAAELHREADRLHTDLQELVMRARMEPLGPTFRRFARTVRDLAASLGKSARLVIEGEDVDVDTKVVEHVRDPLTHLVRNALSHGIELPAERSARGKEPRGLIRLRAFRETGSIVIQVEDDGAGLSRERIAARARERGLVGEASGGEAELQRLIFEPGFSTASAVTEVSGRGVGLDVVRRNVEALRGSVTVTSREGRGTTFTLRLPLSLSIIPGFAVRAAGETYIVPLESVLECLELENGDLKGPDGTGVLSLRGEPLSCRRLRTHFQLEGGDPLREHVVVLQHGSQRLGLVVDTLLGESQTVLKPLGRLLRDLPGIAGSAILGNGRVALVIDLPGLFRQAA
jgi:two-component system chemotaxis sensor kinase CheA